MLSDIKIHHKFELQCLYQQNLINKSKKKLNELSTKIHKNILSKNVLLKAFGLSQSSGS